MLSFLPNVILIFGKSTKKSITKHCTSKFSTLRLFRETRWAVRASSLANIYENYEELECLDGYKDREAKAQIHGVQSQKLTSEYFFGLKLAILLLRHNDNLSTSLRAKDLCAAEAQKT